MKTNPSLARIALCVALFLLQPIQAAVIGEDERRAPGAEEAELRRALGYVFCSKVVNGNFRRSAGTATVVGSRRTILTAAHVFTDSAGRRGAFVRFDPVADCVFRQFDESGDVGAEVGFVQARMGESWRTPGFPNQDWAVLKTAESLPDSAVALPFAGSHQSIERLTGLVVKILAFHTDLREFRRVPLLSEGELFGIQYAGATRLAHTADTGRMSSGAAIIYRTESGVDVVVGVNRSSATFGEFNLAVPVSIELEVALRSFAYGEVPIGGGAQGA